MYVEIKVKLRMFEETPIKLDDGKVMQLKNAPLSQIEDVVREKIEHDLNGIQVYDCKASIPCQRLND
jgi:hypothetical protein